MCLWNIIHGNLTEIRIEDLYCAHIDVTDQVRTPSNTFDMTFRTETGRYQHIMFYCFLCSGTLSCFFIIVWKFTLR